MGSCKIDVNNPFLVAYNRILVPVAGSGLAESAALRACGSERVYPLQEMPAGPWDGPGGEELTAEVRAEPGQSEGRRRLAVALDLRPAETLSLEPAAEVALPPSPIRVERGEWQALTIRNGPRHVRVPTRLDPAQAPPGPLLEAGDERHAGLSTTMWEGAALPTSLDTRIEAEGPCAVQWRCVYRWPDDSSATFVFRWVANSDTLLIAEHISADHEAALVWRPFAPALANALIGGGGERRGRLRPLTPPAHRQRDLEQDGRCLLRHLGHIAYFNQWNLAWVGFQHAAPEAEGDEPFVGVFTGWGAQWRRRGHMRLELWQE
ncbi:MAG: hypothetical protein ACOC9P_01905, partial [bacterium]